MNGKSYMKMLSLVVIVLSGALWLGDIVKPDLNTSIIKTIANIASAVYMFVLCTVLEKLARDFGSSRESTIRTLRIFSRYGSFITTSQQILSSIPCGACSSIGLMLLTSQKTQW